MSGNNENKETKETQDTQESGGAPEQKEGGKESSSSSWYQKPEDLGNAAGDKVEGVLSPVGKHAGPVLETAGKPLGGVLGPTVGGVMNFGKGWGEQMGVGFGNHEGGPAKAQEAEEKRMKEPFGGKEQNAENPLGL
ncbi:hypothetical protein ABEF91_008659 [Exophiala dermatitidis]